MHYTLNKKHLSRISRALFNGATSDLWYDAEDHGDRAAAHRIANLQACMIAASHHIPKLQHFQETKAALDQLLDQVNQMKGLFPDEDGSIARAIEDAEQALKE